MSPTRVLLFGDQTFRPARAVKELYDQSRLSGALKSFLEHSSLALHEYAEDLGAPTSSITALDLAEQHSQQGETSTVVTSALLCIAQLGSAILRAERDPGLFADTASIQHVVGLCTGLIPAAAFATATSVAQLIQMSREVVSLSIRIGIEAQRRSDEIERGSQDWTLCVSKLAVDTAQTMLDTFNDAKGLPQHRKAYISAIADGSGVTISGPPSSIALLLEHNTELASYTSSKLGITAAYHASHLRAPHIANILGNATHWNLPLRKNCRLISTSSGNVASTWSLRTALEWALEDILQLPLRLDILIQSLGADVDGTEVTLIPFVPCGFTQTINRALTSKGKTVTVDKDGQARTFGDDATLGVDPDAIAIVGMSGRFPGGDTLEDFWNVIKSGQDVHTKVPADRFDAASHCDPSGKIKNSTLSAYGCFIDNPGMFDTRLFNMSPREAAQTDPNQRLLLMVTYEALESAGYVHDGTFESMNVGTYVGVSTNDYSEYNSSQDIDVYYVTGGLRAFVSGRLNYHFKWEGPSFALDTACSSSAAAIDLACQALLSGKCSMAVAGGATIMTGPNLYAGLSRGGFLSPTGSCKTFDDGADGYCRGDAIGAVVLKRLSDAIAAGDPIRGVIRGASTNHSAYAASITLPHAQTQQKLFSKVLKDAKLSPEAVSYIEMHGTGTQAGDTIELSSVIETFGSERSANHPLYIGAVKSNVGHSEGAAGITSTIKALLMLREGIIPPHAGIKTRINHKFPPLEEKNIRIARSVEKFEPGNDGKRRVWINNFGATGGNTSLVIEEPPERVVNGTDPRSHHIITVSAKTAYSFRENQKRLHAYLSAHPDANISDVAYTTTARRMQHPIRAVYVASDINDLLQTLSKDLSATGKPSQIGEKMPVIFSFAGQGLQYAGMGKHLFDTSSTFRELVLQDDAVCTALGLPSFLDFMTDSSTDLETASPVKVHCALLSLGLSLARLWMTWGVKPELVMGHSIGEYVALTVAGVLSVADAFFLVGNRAKLLEKHCEKNSHVMVVVNVSKDRVGQLLQSAQLSQSCQISCINATESTVVTMAAGTFEAFNTVCATANIKTTKLNLPYAFHSSQMDALLADFEQLANGVCFNAPKTPVVSTLLGETVTSSGTFSPKYLMRQTREAVDFVAAVNTVQVAYPKAFWIEHGPDATCAGLIKSMLREPQSIIASSLRGKKEDSWKTTSKVLAQAYAAGIQVDWKKYHQEYMGALQMVDLPTYAFDLKNYWMQYEGTWALEKNHHRCAEPAKIMASSPVAPAPAKFLSTCLQQVESETFDTETASVNFASALNHPPLHELISGHYVNGIGLCPSAVYTEMALTAAQYIYGKVYPSKSVPAMNVRDFEIFRPLLLGAAVEGHVVRLHATKAAGTDLIKMSVSSQLGSVTQKHANCVVEFGDGAQWARSWQRNSYLVSDRIAHLRTAAAEGTIDSLRSAVVYKIFSEIVDYPEPYQAIKEFVVDPIRHEAVAKVRFRETPSGVDFTCDPCWIDPIAQVPGFVLNGSTNTPPSLVFLSTGWESLKVAKALSQKTEYQCYTRMQQSDSPGLWLGDAWMFDGDEVIAVATGVKFHEVKKDNLHKVLPGSRNLTGRNLPVATDKPLSPSPAPVQKDNIGRASQPVARPAKQTQSPLPPRKKTVAQPTSIFPKVLQVIANEVGVGLEELVDEAAFLDLGVDSIMTISIGGKLKDDLELDLPLTLFTQCETVSQLREYFQNTYDTDVVEASSSDSSSDEEDGDESGASSATSVSNEGDNEPDIVDIVLATIAKEAGFAEDEIDLDADFLDLGVDSIMTIAVLGAVAEQTGEQLPASLFLEYPTISALRKALGKPTAKQAPSLPPVVPQQHPASPMPKQQATPSKFRADQYKSNVVLLQGNPKSGHTPLFLIADGAGSAASYLYFPQFPSHLPVYGVESPFLNCPEEFTCSIEEICEVYVAAIRAKWPHGPYYLGGWSIGGIYAYETTVQLINLGERVDGVVLIDSPCPHKMEGIPDLTMEILEETGIFVGIPTRGGGPDTPMPFGQKQHIVGCVRAASSYEPIPLAPHQRPLHTYVIWSEQGLFEQLSEKVKEASTVFSGNGEKVGINRDWLTGKRTSFGPKGWDRLLGDCECHPTEGNHFTCMNQPRIKKTGKLVADAIDIFLQKSAGTARSH